MVNYSVPKGSQYSTEILNYSVSKGTQPCVGHSATVQKEFYKDMYSFVLYSSDKKWSEERFIFRISDSESGDRARSNNVINTKPFLLKRIVLNTLPCRQSKLYGLLHKLCPPRSSYPSTLLCLCSFELGPFNLVSHIVGVPYTHCYNGAHDKLQTRGQCSVTSWSTCPVRGSSDGTNPGCLRDICELQSQAWNS